VAIATEKEEEKKKNVELQMRMYEKRLNRLQYRAKQREVVKTKSSVSLSLAPANKSMMPTSTKPINMHVPAANWQLQFENRRHNACVIEID